MRTQAQERQQRRTAGKLAGSRLKPRRPLLPLLQGGVGSPGAGVSDTPGGLAPVKTTPLKFRTRRGAARAKCVPPAAVSLFPGFGGPCPASHSTGTGRRVWLACHLALRCVFRPHMNGLQLPETCCSARHPCPSHGQQTDCCTVCTRRKHDGASSQDAIVVGDASPAAPSTATKPKVSTLTHGVCNC